MFGIDGWPDAVGNINRTICRLCPGACWERQAQPRQQ
jgi:hypothetical protein